MCKQSVYMHIDADAKSDPHCKASAKDLKTTDGYDRYSLRNKIEYPKNPRKLLILFCQAAVFSAINIVLLFVFVVLSFIRRFLQIIGVIKYREYRRGVVGHAKDVSGKRVCVVGCGSSAIAFGKECLEQGMDFKAFDKAPELGGLFTKCAYDIGQLTSSNFFTAFGSFPCGKKDLPCRTIKFSEYVAYMNCFVEHYQLRHYLNFNVEVTMVEQRPDKKWNVTTRANGSDNDNVEVFTHLVVCNGTNRFPNVPHFCGSEKFKGRIMHSSEYRGSEDMVNKRILVIGMGESGSDICLEMASVAKSVLITTRKGPGHVLARYHSRMPNDVETSYAYHAIPRKLWINPRAHGTMNDMPRWWKCKIWFEKAYNLPEDDKLVTDQNSVAYTRYHWMCRFGTKTIGFIKACADFGAKYKEAEVSSIDENGVFFSDGMRYDCDIIFLSTGYKRDLSIMPKDLQTLNYRNDLWMKSIHPKYGDRLAFIGFNRPAIGAIPPLAELTARYVALMMAERLQLPDEDFLMKDVKRVRDYEEWLFPFDAKRLHGLCSYFETWIMLSREIGCDIRFMNLLLTDPVLFHRLLFCQIIPASARFFGYGADYKTAREAVTITHMVPFPTQLIKTFLLLFSCVAAQLGMAEPPTGFNIW